MQIIILFNLCALVIFNQSIFPLAATSLLSDDEFTGGFLVNFKNKIEIVVNLLSLHCSNVSVRDTYLI